MMSSRSTKKNGKLVVGVEKEEEKDAVKNGNIEVCVRIRPLLVSSCASSSSSTSSVKKKKSTTTRIGGGTTTAAAAVAAAAASPPTPTNGGRRLSRLPAPAGRSRPSAIPASPRQSSSSSLLQTPTRIRKSSSATPSTAKTKILQRTPTASTTPPAAAAAAAADSHKEETVLAWDVIDTDTIQQSSKVERIQGRTVNYTLDRVYGPSSTTQELYINSVQPVVLSSLQGYHASVFAYGQTSTGKTYTMTGTPSYPGIVPLAIQDIFDYIQKTPHYDEAPREYLMRISYLEIYNEQIIDLLNDTSSATTPSSIRILEGKDGVSVVRGLREEVVSTPEDIMHHIHRGEKRRQVGATNMNKHSSRSHTIVRLWMESKAENEMTRASSLSLVDLAGSESIRLTGSTGDRQKEGQYINKSLMTLGQVIYKLAEHNTNDNKSNATTNSTTSNSLKNHIPYRDSKLTRLLQPSLSGHAKLVCICNISPSPYHLEESHNTLKFAVRAKKVPQRAVVNVVSDQNTLLQEYKEEIKDLRNQLAMAKKTAASSTTVTTAAAIDVDDPTAATPAETLIPTSDTSTTAGESDWEDTRELIIAITKMEALILKTNNLQTPSNNGHDSLLTMEGADESLSNGGDGVIQVGNAFDSNHRIRNDGDSSLKADEENDNKSLQSGIDTALSSFEESSSSTSPTSMMNHHEKKKPLIDKMEQIQNLLQNVLAKQGRSSSTTNINGKSTNKSLTLKQQKARHDDDQTILVDGLRSQLEELEVTTSLKHADASFLESQLRKKDLLLEEVAKMLEVVEQRQDELESENKVLKQYIQEQELLLEQKNREIRLLLVSSSRQHRRKAEEQQGEKDKD